MELLILTELARRGDRCYCSCKSATGNKLDIELAYGEHGCKAGEPLCPTCRPWQTLPDADPDGKDGKDGKDGGKR